MDTKDNKSQKKLILVAVVLGLLLVGGGAYLALRGSDSKEGSSDANVANQGETDFTQAPTEEEENAGDNVPVKTDPNQPAEDVTDLAVQISSVEVYEGQVEVRASTTTNIFNGSCYVEFSSGDDTVNKILPAQADARSTICLDEPFDVSELSASNSWDVKVQMVSDDGKYKGEATSSLSL